MIGPAQTPVNEIGCFSAASRTLKTPPKNPGLIAPARVVNLLHDTTRLRNSVEDIISGVGSV